MDTEKDRRMVQRIHQPSKHFWLMMGCDQIGDLHYVSDY
jgi:hypothetical protein